MHEDGRTMDAELQATDPHAVDPAAVQATFCATLVDEWARAGVAHAVVAPGSRLRLDNHDDESHTVHAWAPARSAGSRAQRIGSYVDETLFKKPVK